MSDQPVNAPQRAELDRWLRLARFDHSRIGEVRRRVVVLAAAVAVTTACTPALGLAATEARHGRSGAITTAHVDAATRPALHLTPAGKRNTGKPAAAHVRRASAARSTPRKVPAAATAPTVRATATATAPTVPATGTAVRHLFSTPAQPATAPVCKPIDGKSGAAAVSLPSDAPDPVAKVVQGPGGTTVPACPAPTPPRASRKRRVSPTLGTSDGTRPSKHRDGRGGKLPVHHQAPPRQHDAGKPAGPAGGQNAHRHPRGIQIGGPSGGAPVTGPRVRPPGKVAPHPVGDGTPKTGSSTASTTPTPTPTPTGIAAPQAWTGSVSTDPSLAGALTDLSGLLANGNQPPPFLIPIYMEAGRRYHVPWEVLAAINAVETDYGRDLSTSSAGAIGWMQFEPATWREYGVAMDGHNVANPFDPRDAIFAAARLLAAAGAEHDLSGAIFAYNHATWYVNDVLSRARTIADDVHPAGAITKRGIVSVQFASKRASHGVATFKGGFLWHYDRLIATANMVSAANFPYLYGGGHEQPAVFAPFDCSGSVSYVMQQAGYNVPTTVSGDIASWGFPTGPGRVTIFYNPTHTFMRIGNRFFGTSEFARPGGGAGWFDTNKLPASYLARFQEVHVPRLGVNSFAPQRTTESN